MDPEISVIIVNWNSKDYVRTCLHSLRENCSDLVLQVIVVDGASYDGCEAMLRSEFPEAEYIQSKENIGFGQCNNLGVQSAKGRHLLLLNPDCEVRPKAIQTLLQTLNTLPNQGLVGPRLLNTDGTLQTSCVQALPTPINQAIDSNFLRLMLPRLSIWGTYKAFNTSTPTEVEAISGACMLLARSTFEKLKGFSSQYFMYGEDMDICARARQIGYKVYHVPEATVTHHGSGSSTKQPSTFSVLKMREANFLYIKTHNSEAAAKQYKTLQKASATTRILLLNIKSSFSSSKNKLTVQSSLSKWKAIARWASEK